MSDSERIKKCNGQCPFKFKKCDGLCNNCGLEVSADSGCNNIVKAVAYDGYNVSYDFDTETKMNYPI